MDILPLILDTLPQLILDTLPQQLILDTLPQQLILDTLPQPLILDILPQQLIRDIPILITPFLLPLSTLLITDIPTLTVHTDITPTKLYKPQLSQTDLFTRTSVTKQPPKKSYVHSCQINV